MSRAGRGEEQDRIDLLPAPAGRVVERYLGRVDRRLPGVIDGFYVVGSAALGAFRAGSSDLDFVATVSRPLDAGELTRLRAVHRRCKWGGRLRALVPPSSPLQCNGIFVRSDFLSAPPATVRAIAAQVAGWFAVNAVAGVNPITWWELANVGIAVRGPAREQLAVALDDAELRAWTAANLVSYWRPWAAAVARRGPASWAVRVRQLHARRLAAWGVLGAARMHATIATGEVISKPRAGEYALATFEPRWHAVIEDALAYWCGSDARPAHARRRPARVLRAETAAFVAHVVDLAGVPREPPR